MGHDHHFSDVQGFHERIDEGRMAFWDYTLRNYYGYDNALLARNAGSDPCIIAGLARMAVRMARVLPYTATVFLDAADEGVLRARLHERYQDPDELYLREAHWHEEQVHAPLFDLRVSEAELANADSMLSMLTELAASLR
jgi:guanylate kinase